MNTRRQSETPDPESTHLDNEITNIRNQIQTLQRRKRFLSSSLLASNNIQSLLRKPVTSLQDDLSPLAKAAGKHAETNHHRIAFGATAFPFKDPSPNGPSENLLGVRIDISTRKGRFTKPYYVLLRREKDKKLSVHRHTVPTFISVSKLARVYLPSTKRNVADEDSEEESDEEEQLQAAKQARNTRQDLHGFVRELRRELVAWHLRCDAVDMLREKLGLSETDDDRSSERLSPDSKAGVVSLEATAVETRYVRLDWEDGRVGRFKLSNTGLVERAVVIGDQGRDKLIEDAMVGGGGRIEGLLERLQKHAAS